MKIFRLSLLLLALASPVLAADSASKDPASKPETQEKGGGAMPGQGLFRPELACWGDFYCYADPNTTYECCAGLGCLWVCEQVCGGHCDGYEM